MTHATGRLTQSTAFTPKGDYPDPMTSGGNDIVLERAACCAVCWALVPPTLMHFHRAWHEEVERAAAVAARAELKAVRSHAS